MKILPPKLFLWIFAGMLLGACQQKPEKEIREDWKKFYQQYQLEGSFVLFDQRNDRFLFYNPEQFQRAFIPASTFKICNSLIGLETGVIANDRFVIPWDGQTRSLAAWNADQDLKTAFRNSTVWYYQDLARRVGGKQMKYWLEKVGYGNADTSGGIDQFWLSGGLRISPEQQIGFLKRLRDNDLPFSQRSMDIVKRIMVSSDSAGITLRAKTGWGQQENQNIGWYVGYVETPDNVYYFCNCIQSGQEPPPNFPRARPEITFMILKDLKIIPALP